MATAADGQPRTTRTPTTSSFSRASSSPSAALHMPPNAGVKLGPNGAAFVSSGIPDLDRILGGGFLLGSLVMVMEDSDAPHHLLLLRNFMSQGIVHRQPILFVSPLREPRAFLGTLPSPASSSKAHSKRAIVDPNQQEQEKGLRIAWQYKKYFGEQQASQIHDRDVKQEFSNDFDLRKPLERRLVQNIECISIQDTPELAILRDRCSSFLSTLPRSDGGNLNAGRIAIQSFCSPQCGYSEMDWDMVAFIRFLRSIVRSSNAVAVLTFPRRLLSSLRFSLFALAMTTEEVTAVAAAVEDVPSAPDAKLAKSKKAKAPKEPKAKKVAAPRKPSAHPPYAEMIKEAIITLKERTGSSPYAIGKFIEDKHKAHLPSNFRKMLLLQLKKLAAAGKLTKVKSSYKLSTVAALALSAPSKPKAVAASKKPAAVPAKAKAKAKPAAAKSKAKAVSTAKPKPKSKSAAAAKPKAATVKAKVAPKRKSPAKPKPAARPAKSSRTAARGAPGKKPAKSPAKKASTVKKPKSVKSSVKKTVAKKAKK